MIDRVKAGRCLLPKTPDHFLAEHRLSLADGIGIFNDSQIGIDNNDTSVIQIGKLFEFRIHNFVIGVVQIPVGTQMIRNDLALVLHVRGTDRNRPILVIGKKGLAQNNAWQHPRQADNQENTEAQAPPDSQILDSSSYP